MKTTAAVLVAGFSSAALAASGCSNVLVPTYQAPSVAAGWQAQLVAAGFKKPRSIQFDSVGNLLVVESGKGITRLSFTDNGNTCLSVSKNTLLVNQTSLNHGLALSADGKTLYASSLEAVFAWSFDASAGTVGANPQTIVNGMSNNDLTTRTLLVTKENMLVVSRGSSDGLTIQANNVSSGLSQIRAFNLANVTSTSKPYSFNTQGRVLGWGLRNSVGVAQHPVTGGIYSVDNSIDGVHRDGIDIHQDNPGEELNYHGLVTDAKAGGNYGYPNCFAVWDVAEIPDNAGLTVGMQFAQTENSTMNDETCASDFVAPRLTFPAHQAPLDIKFTADGSAAYISFHGSFATDHPVGYRISTIAFNPSTGEPVARSDSTSALSDIISNPDMTKCPDSCFRPVGLAWDNQGRLWMSSDTTGEIYVLQKATTSPTTTASGTIITATSAPSAAGRAWSGATALLGWAVALAVGAVLVL